MTIVLVGPHGVGKSTLGRLLAHDLQIPFDDEIGATLAADLAWRPREATAATPQSAFDEEVFRRELARDAARGDSPRVVESWHPANLAYATRRSPNVVERHLPAVCAAVARGPVVVVPLLAPPEILATRQWEPGSAQFFLDVGTDAFAWAARLGCVVRPYVWTHQRPADALAAHVAAALEPSWTTST